MTKPQADFIIAMTIALGFMLWMAKDLFNTIHETPNTKVEMVYDCRLAEISPDYPIVVKERCRKIMQPRVRAIG